MKCLFLFALFSITASAAPADCGLSGDISHRISDCFDGTTRSRKVSAQDVEWDLVSRRFDAGRNRSYEVWRDSQGQVWGDELDSQYTHEQAVRLDESGNVEWDTACYNGPGTESERAAAGIQEKRFGLPTIAEFKLAEAHGIRSVFTDEGGWFWTTDLPLAHPMALHRLVYGDKEQAMLFDASTGGVQRYFSDTATHVRCVGRD